MTVAPTDKELHDRDETVRGRPGGCGCPGDGGDVNREILDALASWMLDRVFISNQHHNIVWATAEARRLHGRDLIGMKCYAACCGRDHACEPCVTSKTLADGRAYEHHTEGIGADGEKTVLRCASKVTTRNPDGSPRAVMAICRVVDVREPASKMLQENRQNLRSLFDSLDDFIFVVDGNARIVSTNPVMLKRLGYSMVQLMGMTLPELHPPERRQEALDIISDMLAGKTSLCLIPLMAEDGTLIPVETKVVQGEWDGQDVLFGVSREVTKRIQAEEKLQKAHEELEQQVRQRTAELEAANRRLMQEIGERRRMKAALKRAEQQTEAILDNLVERVVYQDRDMKIQWANRAACESENMTREEVKGRYCYDLWAGRESPCEDCPVEEFRRSGRLQTIEKSTPDGKTWHIQVSPICDSDGHVVGMVEVTLDETRRKQAEHALRESERRFRVIFERAPIGIALITLDYRLVAANQAYCRLLDCTEQELQSTAVTDFTYPGDLEQNLALEQQLARSEIPCFQMEKRFIRRNGEVATGLLAATVIRDDQGKPAYYLRQVLDITQQVKAHEALRKSEERYRMLVETMTDGLVMVDTRGILSYANDRALDILGGCRDEIVGSSLMDFLDEANQRILSEQLEKRRKGGQTPYQLTFTRENGDKIPTILSPKPLFDDEGHVVGSHAVITEITELKKAEGALIEAYLTLETVLNSIDADVFVADLQSHHILFANKHMHNTYGPDLVGKSCHRVCRRESDPCGDCLNIRLLNADGEPAGLFVWEEVNPVSGRVNLNHTRAIKWVDGRFVRLQISADITEIRQAKEQIQILTRNLINAAEQERKRIAQDLHDEFGQALTALYFGAAALRDSLPRELEQQIAQSDVLVEAIEDMADRIRKICSELRPGILDHLGLLPTFEHHIEEFVQQWPGIQVDFQASGFKRRFDPLIEVIPYRILQEGLNNVAKHAKAGHVRVTLTYSHPHIILAITDDGVGFEQTQDPRTLLQGFQGIGLLGMRERVEAVGGHFEIHSRVGRGTSLRAEIPVP